jgi:GNAT superfamily N-acetyltransferase
MLNLVFRPAVLSDLETIVAMLADDTFGAARESSTSPLSDAYYKAFDAINKDPNNELIVAERQGVVVAALQLTFIPGLTFHGGWRAMIEGVRVSSAMRSSGIGTKLIQWAVDRARARDCKLVQLTTNKLRTDSIRFYERLGFVATHEGMKMPIERAS